MTTPLNIKAQRLVEDITQQFDTTDLVSDVEVPNEYKTSGANNSDITQFFDEVKALAEYHVAFALASAFEYRKKEAKAKLEELAIITKDDADLEPNELPYNIYTSDAATLQLKVSKPVQRIDNKRLVTELRKAGVDSVLIDEALEKATSYNAPAKSYTVTLN